MNVIKDIRMNEKTLFGRKTRFNSVYSLLVFQLLLVCPFFVIRNPFNINGSPLGGKVGFFEAYKIYSKRWSLETVFKECMGLLGLGKCQSNNFAAQIASTMLVASLYNILSVVKRFIGYETIGELFRQTNQDRHELSICERIWKAILELVAATPKV